MTQQVVTLASTRIDSCVWPSSFFNSSSTDTISQHYWTKQEKWKQLSQEQGVVIIFNWKRKKKKKKWNESFQEVTQWAEGISLFSWPICSVPLCNHYHQKRPESMKERKIRKKRSLSSSPFQVSPPCRAVRCREICIQDAAAVSSCVAEWSLRMRLATFSLKSHILEIPSLLLLSCLCDAVPLPLPLPCRVEMRTSKQLDRPRIKEISSSNMFLIGQLFFSDSEWRWGRPFEDLLYEDLSKWPAASSSSSSSSSS